MAHCVTVIPDSAFSVVSSAEEVETVADVRSHAAFPMKYCREKKVLPDIMQHRF